jgi:hypothetical protein
MKSALGILLWLAGLDEVKVGAPDVRIVYMVASRLPEF